MASLIEQAAERLEQLRQAGIAIPEVAWTSPGLPTRAEPEAGFTKAAALEIDPPAAAADPTPIVRTLVDASPSPPQITAPQSQHVEFDLVALAAANVVTPNAPRSQVADEFRVVKRPLLTNAKGKGENPPANANLIMVTSAIAGEGKSFTSINLAMSIATELDHTVMLVDADLARPSLPRMLGVDEGPGLLDVLDGTAEMSSVLLRTNVEKLTFLRSGTPHPRATELLASEAMQRLLDEMSKRYSDRIIIFDSPPLLLTTEARTLATLMGQVVFVVRAGKTLQSVVQHALATIEACPVRMMLLNQARPEKHGIYGDYGMGYGYAYGYGYGYGSKGNGI
jgi:protein-tyrosine kinase